MVRASPGTVIAHRPAAARAAAAAAGLALRSRSSLSLGGGGGISSMTRRAHDPCEIANMADTIVLILPH